MNQNGYSLENDPDDPIFGADKQPQEVPPEASCETLTEDDAEATLDSSLSIKTEVLDEDRAPDQLDLGGVFFLAYPEDWTG